mgnify:CR=1 FL=1
MSVVCCVLCAIVLCCVVTGICAYVCCVLLCCVVLCCDKHIAATVTSVVVLLCCVGALLCCVGGSVSTTASLPLNLTFLITAFDPRDSVMAADNKTLVADIKKRFPDDLTLIDRLLAF